MEWSKLLSTKRVGELFDKPASDPDIRTAFERDYGRAVFSTPVRRLQDKTQVFPLEEHDSIRTRLTHSLEVSSVARTLGRLAGVWIKKNRHESLEPADLETIAATCALIHDLGNPPFGHSGEDAIKSWFKEQLKGTADPSSPSIFDGFPDTSNRSQYAQDFLNWEGNAQTLRLISRLQVLSDMHGLNLTCATFSAACKYTVPSDKASKGGPHHGSKPGYFASESEIVESVRKEVGSGTHRNPITFLVEAADDIVYRTGDLEDGVRKKLLTWPRLCDQLRESSKDILGRENAILEQLIKKSQDKVVFASRNRNDEEAAQMFRTLAIGEMVFSVLTQFEQDYNRIMNGEYDTELVSNLPSEMKALMGACRDVGAKFVYPSQATLKLELMGRRVIHDLMDVFWEGAQICGNGVDCKGFSKKAYSLISKNYQEVFTASLERHVKTGKLPERYCRLQLVTDQISGMTDSYATMLHKKLMNG